MAGIASNWKVLSGENNWDGLLDPIDDNLRHYLINYGFLTAAAPAAVNGVRKSPGYALSRYPPENYFSEVGIEKGNPFKYQVTDFFYGRSEIDIEGWPPAGQSAYFGFVAVTTDEGKIVTGRRDIVVCWRGTTFMTEAIEDLDAIFTSGSDLFPDTDAKVHEGFHNIYTTSKSDSTYNKRSAREQVLAAVRRNVDKYALKEDVSITITGHSLGSALATLNAMDIAFNGYNKPSGSDTGYPVTAFVFASPRVGNKEFQDVFNGLQDAGTLHLLRIRNHKDIVPELPPKIFDFIYEDVGVELYLDTTKSQHIKGESIQEAHDLNLYMHGVAGYQGKDQDFELVITLDFALLNKYNDLLQDSYGVPPKWWSNVFRQGMIQLDDGTWKLNDYVPDPPTDDDAATAATENGTN